MLGFRCARNDLDDFSSIVKPVQVDATLLDVTCCIHLHALLHVVACCWTMSEVRDTPTTMLVQIVRSTQ